MAEIKPMQFGTIYFRPAGDATIGFMSAGEGLVEISFEPADEAEEDVSIITTPNSSVSVDMSFNIDDESLMDAIMGDTTTPRFSIEITYKTGKPPRPHWKANIFVWWYYFKDCIKWYNSGKPTFERTITIPNAGVK